MTTLIPAPTETANMRESFCATMDRALDEDPRLAVVLADISASMLTDAAARHPHRVVNLGIREQALISVAAGLAATGLRPVVHTFGSFLVERPFEQVKVDLGHQGLGAILVSYGASYDMPAAGRTHQSPGDVALIDSLPDWTVHVPGHPAEAETLLRKAFRTDNRVYLRLSSQANNRPYDVDGDGTLKILRRGRNGLVLAIGPTADRVLAATADLDVTVGYAATARPLDGQGIRAAVRAADRADVVLVEPYLAGTSAYLVDAALDDIPHRLRCLGVSREVEVRMYGEHADHDAVHGLDTPGIAASIRDFVHA
jgi:transketolase